MTGRVTQWEKLFVSKKLKVILTNYLVVKIMVNKLSTVSIRNEKDFNPRWTPEWPFRVHLAISISRTRIDIKLKLDFPLYLFMKRA